MLLKANSNHRHSQHASGLQAAKPLLPFKHALMSVRLTLSLPDPLCSAHRLGCRGARLQAAMSSQSSAPQRCSTRRQLKAGLCRLSLTALCALHIHCCSAQLDCVAGGLVLNACCVSTQAQTAPWRLHGPQDSQCQSTAAAGKTFMEAYRTMSLKCSAHSRQGYMRVRTSTCSGTMPGRPTGPASSCDPHITHQHLYVPLLLSAGLFWILRSQRVQECPGCPTQLFSGYRSGQRLWRTARRWPAHRLDSRHCLVLHVKL